MGETVKLQSLPPLPGIDKTHMLAEEFGGTGGRQNVVPFGWYANQNTASIRAG